MEVGSGAGVGGRFTRRSVGSSSRLAKPDAGRDTTVVPPVGVAVGTGLFIVHDYAVRGARGAGGWLLVVAYEMALARKLLA